MCCSLTHIVFYLNSNLCVWKQQETRPWQKMPQIHFIFVSWWSFSYFYSQYSLWLVIVLVSVYLFTHLKIRILKQIKVMKASRKCKFVKTCCWLRRSGAPPLCHSSRSRVLLWLVLLTYIHFYSDHWQTQTSKYSLNNQYNSSSLSLQTAFSTLFWHFLNFSKAPSKPNIIIVSMEPR